MQNDYAEHIKSLQETGRLRELHPLSQRSGCRVDFKGRSMLNMTSNDYLGIAGDVKIHNEFYRSLNSENIIGNYGLGAASSRLLTGDTYISHKLEATIAQAYGRSSCLLFNSGYHANIGILPALTDKRDLILSDKLNHASIIDGCRLSRASFKRYRHLDYSHLQSLLTDFRNDYDRVIIVTESVFSMDGDEVDLHKLVEIKRKFDCLLYVDEAHSVGVFGKKGLGKSEENGLISDIDLLIGTFGKAFASVGAYLICDVEIREYLINYSRSLIFTTALPPVILSWNNYIFNQIITMEERRSNLQKLSKQLRERLAALDIPSRGITNIVPVIIGDNSRSVELAEKMREYGFLIFAVRPPTVPEGTARFRLSLTADMTWADLEELPRLIHEGLHHQ